jgi:hypothetical protein
MRAADIGKAMSALLSSSIGRDTSAPRCEICCLFQSMRSKLGSRGTECEALREAISIEKRYIGERKSLLILVSFERIARAPFTRRRNMIAEP